MKLASLLWMILAGVVILLPAAAHAIVITTVPVGNAGNASDTTGFGGVGYDYRIGKFEVTNSQYAAFLNAKAVDADPYGLFDSRMNTDDRGGIVRSSITGAYSVKIVFASKPVNFVDFYDAIRFANWMNNGQGSADTETGAYTLAGGTAIPSNGATLTRNPGATWFLPSENEWYKAAYYDPRTTGQGGPPADGHYWLYPTSSNTAPQSATASAVGEISNPGSNVANYNFTAVWNGSIPNVTGVGGAGPLSVSPWGTSDQGGNLWEFNEAIYDSTSRGARGGSMDSSAANLTKSLRDHAPLAIGQSEVGFRLATIAVPEPAALVLGLSAAPMLALWRVRRMTRVPTRPTSKV